MVRQTLLDDVLSLPLNDRIEMLERLRDNLRSEPVAKELSELQRRTLDQRIDDFEQNPRAGSPWSEVEARIRAGLK